MSFRIKAVRRRAQRLRSPGTRRRLGGRWRIRRPCPRHGWFWWRARGALERRPSRVRPLFGSPNPCVGCPTPPKQADNRPSTRRAEHRTPSSGYPLACCSHRRTLRIRWWTCSTWNVPTRIHHPPYASPRDSMCWRSTPPLGFRSSASDIGMKCGPRSTTWEDATSIFHSIGP